MESRDLSTRIKERRLELGLTTSALARRAGTSAAAVCRYEGGWQRFEVGTLRKIATALGCRLDVDLVPLRPARPRGRISALAAAKRLRRLFWDHDLKGGDLKKYPTWVIARALEYGSLDDISMLVGFFGRNRFLKLVAESSFTSSRTEAFWYNMLEMEGVRCTKRSFRREAWIS